MWLSISVATSFKWGQLTPVLPAVNCVRASMLLRAVTDDWETLALYTIQGMGFLLTPTAFFTCEYPNKTWNVTSVLGSSAVLVLLQSTSVARVSSCLQLNTYSDTLYNCADLLFLLWKYLTCLTRDSEQGTKHMLCIGWIKPVSLEGIHAAVLAWRVAGWWAGWWAGGTCNSP